MILNSKLKEIWKKAVVVLLQVSPSVHEGAEESNKKPQDSYILVGIQTTQL
jgi:hypothetical protein